MITQSFTIKSIPDHDDYFMVLGRLITCAYICNPRYIHKTIYTETVPRCNFQENFHL